jgi:hypothetical protein
MAQPGWWVAAAALGRLSGSMSWPGSAAAAFDALGELAPALAGLSHGSLGWTGRVAGTGAAMAGAPA